MFKGKTYLVIVDRYSNWPIIERSSEGSKGLINCLRHTFATYGIPDELSSDGGMEFMSHSTQKFLADWGVRHRVSSVAFPHSNCRAEIGVKSAKRILAENTNARGDLNLDAFQRAILTYRNTPSPDTKLSPSQCVFGRTIKDFIPIPRNNYRPLWKWADMLDNRERALMDRSTRMRRYWSEHTKVLPPLRVGQHVRVQNQIGPHARKWDKTGIVVEVRQHDQYVVKLNGSNRVTLRNRKFLRKYEAVHDDKQDELKRRWSIVTPREASYSPRQQSITRPTNQSTRQQHSPDRNDDRSSLPCNPNWSDDQNLNNASPDADVSTRELVPPASGRDEVITPPQKLPLAVRRLYSHNKPGLKE